LTRAKQNPDVTLAAREMATTILDALIDFGDTFSHLDVLEIADTVLAQLPVEELGELIAQRLLLYGEEQEDMTGYLSRDPAAVNTWARLAWAETLPEVDRLLPRLGYVEEEDPERSDPPTLTAPDGRACDCGCNEKRSVQ
jgi:hypothetical protein